jgi:hypothetical protein
MLTIPSTQIPSTQPVPRDPATTGTAPAPTMAETLSTPKALIASELPIYDKNADGILDKPECAAWMGALKAKTGAKPMSTSDMTKCADGAFTTADADKSKSVTLAELQSYLAHGA